MNYENEKRSMTTDQKSGSRKKNVFIGFLLITLFASLGFIIVDKNKTGKALDDQLAQIATESNKKSEIQKNFDESLVRLDSIGVLNNELNAELIEKNREIAKQKTEIRSILNKRNATAAELARARELIASLNEKITDMEFVVQQLTNDNQVLVQEKNVLIKEKEKLTEDITAVTIVKEELAAKVDIGSTLNASNIAITPVKIRKSEKEKVTTSAKKVDKLVISFDVNNRIAESGMTDVFVCVIDPDGNLIKAENTGSFLSREEGDKSYTARVPVEIEPAKRKLVEFSFVPETDFKQGNYKVQIYQNGFLIGESTRELKKSGLFG